MKRKEWLVIHPTLSMVGLGFMLKTRAFLDSSPPGFLGVLRNSTFIVGRWDLGNPRNQ